MTMTLISTVTVGVGGAANIIFSSIPTTYTDLYLVTSIRGTAAVVTTGLYSQLNGDTTGTNYARRLLLGTGSTAASYTFTGVLALGSIPGASATANTFGNSSAYFLNYLSSTSKTVSTDCVAENNATATELTLAASSWSGTTAINSIMIYTDNGIFAQYSTASLYGISTTNATGATVA